MTQVYHTLATSNFFQNWSDTNLITTSDDWSGVPSIIGARGDCLTSTDDVDPQTVLSNDMIIPDVNANETNVATTTGGVLEMQIANPTIALQGSATADAPYLLLHMDATGRQNVTLSFNARELDISGATQQIAVQYRIGNSGSYTNLPAGYIADASTGMGASVTPVTVALGATANNAAQIQIRIMTTNASGSDSLIGIDDILVTSSAIGNTAPTIVGLNPAQMYGEQSPAFIIDSDVTVADAELDALNGGLGNYNGASIQIADAALSATNVFDFGMSFVQRVGNELQIMGGTIAVLSFGPGYIGINFTDTGFFTPTTAIVNEVLQKLTYANTSGNPPASVTLNYVITDVGALTGGDSIQIFMSASPDAPTDIGLSSTTVQEFRANGTVVATLSTADEDGSSNTYTYTLLNSAGGRFTIVGNQLRVANGLLFDFEQATSHNITVRTSDGTTTFDKGFAITVGNVDPETIVGDGAANTLVGGAGADNFQGGGGIDILRGNANNDQLNGGIGNDTMEGGLGNDIYTVDISTDSVVEAGVGTDLVNSSAANFTLGANVENLTLTGVGNINGTGNTLANVLTGNAGNNIFNGGGGVDTMIGLGGNDIYTVDS